jgi:RNA polymerase sigma-70 factor, ECF subfamily
MSADEDALTTDLVLLQRAAAGDRPAAARFVERHQSAVFRHASFLTATREDAEDVLQETFLAALRGAGGFRGDASARTWLFTIARHAALRKPREVLVADEAGLELLAEQAGWGTENPESLAALAEDRQRLESALRALAAEDRDVVLLRDYEGLSGEETARALDISLAAMKSRLHRGRLRLAALLRSGVRSGEGACRASL